MQSNGDIRTISDASPQTLSWTEPEGDSCCLLTQKIVIVSPMPAGLHELTRELAARCFDVLLLHRPNEETVRSLRPGLVIVDRTHEGERVEQERQPGYASSPQLHLVAPGARTPLAGPGEAFLPWPLPVGEAVQYIRRLSEVQAEQPAPVQAAPGQTRFKDLLLDEKRCTVYRGAQRLELTRTEFELLRMLLAAGGAVLSRQALLDGVWGEHYFGGSNTVDVHLKSLRQKLGDDPKRPTYIATVRGVGYRLNDDSVSF